MRALRALVSGLDELCRRQRAVLLRIEPDLADRPDQDAAIRGAGFRHSSRAVQPASTILIDLADSPDTWLARMSPKNRYNIRLSERKGIAVCTGSEQDIAAFHELIVMTGQRDGFAVHSLEYYRESYRIFRETDQVRLLLAKYEGRLLAGLMAFACGPKAFYLYGASSNDERQRMPNYALQWAAMNWAKERGCRSYDLWGIPDEASDWEASQPERLKVPYRRAATRYAVGRVSLQTWLRRRRRALRERLRPALQRLALSPSTGVSKPADKDCLRDASCRTVASIKRKQPGALE